MLRSCLAVLTLLAVTELGSAAPVPAHLRPAAIPFDFPTRAGTAWGYRSGGLWYELVVVKAEERDGVTVLGRFLQVGGCGHSGGSVLVSAKGVSEGGRRPFLVFPLRVGATWADGEATATVRGVEPVAVPAGRYDAVRVDEVAPVPGGEAVTVTSWYASGVGLVKRVQKVGDREPQLVTVLESFTPGKK